MNRMASFLLRFLREEDGPTAVEYAFLLSLILLAALTSIVTFGQKTGQLFEHAENVMP